MKLNISICNEDGIVLEDLICESDAPEDTEVSFAWFLREIIQNHVDTSEAD